MVFQHSCIPLNVQLRKERQDEEKSSSGDEQFLELLTAISTSLRTGKAPEGGISWSHDYGNLFTTRMRKRVLHAHSKRAIIKIFQSRTFWYPRLKSNCKLMVKHLVDDGKLLHIKEILHVADGVICQLLVSFPEILMPAPGQHAYAVTDQISNSIISNCLFNYRKVVKEIKEFRKGLRKAAFERRPFAPPHNRQMTWTIPIVDYYNDIATSNSKEKMFRVCTFAQTRSTGLADHKMVEETLSEFIEQVTTPTDCNPDATLMEAIDEVTRDVVFDADALSPHFRASMSTSACRESSRRNEGKFGWLRQLTSDRIVPVSTEPSPDNEGGEIGTPLWWRSYRKARNRDADVFSVNVAGIRENGKCRVVTSGSFYKDVLLQPFSHLTIEMIKSNPQLEQGLKAGRLGWEFIRHIDNLDPVRGEILFEDDVSALSFDFRKATDGPAQKSGRLVMQPILKGIGLDDEVIEVLLDVWVGTKYLYRNGKFVGEMVRGIPMGDPLTKTNLSLVHPICSLYARKKIGRRIVYVGTGNGDDGNQIAAGPFRHEYFEHFLAAAKQLGYEQSVDDTFITNDWMTYCEEVFRLPIDRFHTVRNACRINDSRISPYLDHPKGRLIIDTRKDRQDYSSDPKGKYTLLGKELEYVRKDGTGGVNFLFSVSSACQDIGLGLCDRYEPVTLPKSIFGTGKPPPGWDELSWFNAIKSQRRYPRYVTIAAMKEMLKEYKPNLTNLRGVVRDQPHFSGEGVTEVLAIPEDDPLKRFRVVKSSDWDLFPAGVLDKLIMGGRLVRESKLSGYYLFHKRMAGILEEVTDLFEVIASQSQEILDYSDDEIKGVISRFVKRFSNQPWLLSRALKEDLYPDTIVQVMSQADPLRVDMPDLTYLKRFRRRPRPDTPHKRAVDQLATWFDDNFENILDGNSYELPPQDVLADDELIIMAVTRSDRPAHLIVSDDKRMVRKCSRICVDKLIMRVPVTDWVQTAAPAREYLELLGELVGREPMLHIDSGSLDTFMDTTGATYSYGVPVIDPLIRSWNESVERRTPAKQSEIYRKFRVRPIVNKEFLMSTIEVVTHKDAQIRTAFNRAIV
uniref:RNA-dependent RNA polymerase n=1 Tax=Nanning Narna tick virus 2 TaxID=2972226 RepID=A0A9E7V1W9_9VIRU|nr:MAG: hypothetical protein [Nanning Narna tick virus 2]